MSSRSPSSRNARLVAIALLVIGALALAAAIVYFTVPAHSLPSIFGRMPNAKGHRNRRAIAGLVAGLLLWIGAAVAFVRSRRLSRASD